MSDPLFTASRSGEPQPQETRSCPRSVHVLGQTAMRTVTQYRVRRSSPPNAQAQQIPVVATRSRTRPPEPLVRIRIRWYGPPVHSPQHRGTPPPALPPVPLRRPGIGRRLGDSTGTVRRDVKGAQTKTTRGTPLAIVSMQCLCLSVELGGTERHLWPISTKSRTHDRTTDQ
jgi:hypothetical protein